MKTIPIFGIEEVKGLTDVVEKEVFDFAVGSWVVERAEYDPLDQGVLGNILWCY